MYSVLITLIVLSSAQAASTQTLTKAQCRKLVINHKANDTVEYKAGVDVNGKPVVPADLGSKNDYGLGKEVGIDLQLPLRQYSPFFSPPPGAPGAKDYINDALNKSELHIGSIVVHDDGKMWINGQPVHDEVQEEIAEACRQQYPDL